MIRRRSLEKRGRMSWNRSAIRWSDRIGYSRRIRKMTVKSETGLSELWQIDKSEIGRSEIDKSEIANIRKEDGISKKRIFN